MDRYIELSEETPLYEEVSKEYDPRSEQIHDASYKRDLEVAKLKRSL